MKKEKSKMLYQIKSSKIHGSGVFAKRDIPKGTQIIEYVGEIISRKEGTKRANEQYEKAKKTGSGSVYVFELNKKQDIDGNFPWNPARFINHSCEPNCKYKKIDDQLWIVSIKNIKRNEELSFDYGFDLEDYEEYLCKCDSKNCRGYIIGKRYLKKFERMKNLSGNILKHREH